MRLKELLFKAIKPSEGSSHEYPLKSIYFLSSMKIEWQSQPSGIILKPLKMSMPFWLDLCLYSLCKKMFNISSYYICIYKIKSIFHFKKGRNGTDLTKKIWTFRLRVHRNVWPWWKNGQRVEQEKKRFREI